MSRGSSDGTRRRRSSKPKTNEDLYGTNMNEKSEVGTRKRSLPKQEEGERKGYYDELESEVASLGTPTNPTYNLKSFEYCICK